MVIFICYKFSQNSLYPNYCSDLLQVSCSYMSYFEVCFKWGAERIEVEWSPPGGGSLPLASHLYTNAFYLARVG